MYRVSITMFSAFETHTHCCKAEFSVTEILPCFMPVVFIYIYLECLMMACI